MPAEQAPRRAWELVRTSQGDRGANGADWASESFESDADGEGDDYDAGDDGAGDDGEAIGRTWAGRGSAGGFEEMHERLSVTGERDDEIPSMPTTPLSDADGGPAFQYVSELAFAAEEARRQVLWSLEEQARWLEQASDYHTAMPMHAVPIGLDMLDFRRE